jgi:hypothetical protein
MAPPREQIEKQSLLHAIVGGSSNLARASIDMSSSTIADDPTQGSSSTHRKEEDFLFGSISAAKYQEFHVIKINKRGKRQ